MFGKLFGRGKAKRDAFGVETSATLPGVPGGDPATTVTTTTTTSSAAMPAGWSGLSAVSGMKDLGAILATVKAAQEQSGGDRQAMAEMLRAQFGGDAVVVDQHGSVDWSAVPQQQQEHQDPIALLATLTELRDKGVVTDEQFEAQKRRLLGSG